MLSQIPGSAPAMLASRGAGAFFFLLLHPVQPFSVGQRAARGDHADPGAMGRLSKVDRDAELACENAQSGDVILVLVSDEDGVESCGSSPAIAMRLISSRQESPASTRTRVLEEEMTVLLPLEPEASTVIRIMRLRYAVRLWVFGQM